MTESIFRRRFAEGDWEGKVIFEALQPEEEGILPLSAGWLVTRRSGGDSWPATSRTVWPRQPVASSACQMGVAGRLPSGVLGREAAVQRLSETSGRRAGDRVFTTGVRLEVL